MPWPLEIVGRFEMEKAYTDAQDESRTEIREFVELQREANRLLTLIAAKLDRTQN